MARRVAVNFIMGLDCIVDADDAPCVAVVRHAPIAALDFLPTVKAGERFSLNAWVYLDGTEPAEVVASTFVALVDEAARTITVSGRMKVGGDVASPFIQRALVVGIAATPVGPGAWTVCVADVCVASALPAALEADVPAAGTCWPLTVV